MYRKNNFLIIKIQCTPKATRPHIKTAPQLLLPTLCFSEFVGIGRGLCGGTGIIGDLFQQLIMFDALALFVNFTLEYGAELVFSCIGNITEEQSDGAVEVLICGEFGGGFGFSSGAGVISAAQEPVHSNIKYICNLV